MLRDDRDRSRYRISEINVGSEQHVGSQRLVEAVWGNFCVNQFAPCTIRLCMNAGLTFRPDGNFLAVAVSRVLETGSQFT